MTTPTRSPWAGNKPRTEVTEYLDQLKAKMSIPSAAATGRGRLVFALDATASRQPTWDQACRIQGEMFEATAALGGLDLQLVFYRGFSECKASRWLYTAADLHRIMRGVTCVGGETQIERVLTHTISETGKRKVSALVLMLIVGIDPGLSGAIALLRCDGGAVKVEDVLDMPVFLLSRGGRTKRELDTHGLVAILRNGVISHAFVEQVASMPGQGVSSVFAFGQAYGAMLGVLAAAGIPFTKVPPARWKRMLGVPAAKDGARARASELLPESAPLWRLVKHDGRAEAALIGLYGYRVFQPPSSLPPA